MQCLKEFLCIFSFYFFEYLEIDGFLQDGSTEDPLYDQLEKAMSDAENSRREAFEEAVRRAKAEKYAFEATRKV
jgi:hypothetical protein